MTTQGDRLESAIERLVSNGPAVAEGLRQAGYQSLALQTEQDIEILAALVTDAARERAST